MRIVDRESKKIDWWGVFVYVCVFVALVVAIEGRVATNRVEKIVQPIERVIEKNGTISLVGSPGPKGDKGNRGAQGLRGASGLPGRPGTRGAQGPSGPRGATGARGPRGGQGSRGPAGGVGPAGVPGAAGVAPAIETILAQLCDRLPPGLC